MVDARMDYSDHNPNYSVSTLREVLRSLDRETLTRLKQDQGVVLDGDAIDCVDVFTLNEDDMMILQDLAQRDDY